MNITSKWNLKPAIVAGSHRPARHCHTARHRHSSDPRLHSASGQDLSIGVCEAGAFGDEPCHRGRVLQQQCLRKAALNNQHPSPTVCIYIYIKYQILLLYHTIAILPSVYCTSMDALIAENRNIHIHVHGLTSRMNTRLLLVYTLRRAHPFNQHQNWTRSCMTAVKPSESLLAWSVTVPAPPYCQRTLSVRPLGSPVPPIERQILAKKSGTSSTAGIAHNCSTVYIEQWGAL